MTPPPRQLFDGAVQHERTALAWERTAVALMVAGALVLNRGAEIEQAWAEVMGLTTVTAAAMILLWAARRYEALHRALRAGTDVTSPVMIASAALLSSVLAAGALVLVLMDAFA